tara:strand:+ start:117 stop:278 length:162 start_codon:yes stop_codon:yes gene_type:complete
MNNNLNKRNGVTHLYNPKKEGLGSYDLNYINAYKKNKISRRKLKEKGYERYVA